MVEQPDNVSTPPKPGYAWPIATVAIVLILVVGALWTWKSCVELPMQVLDRTTQAVAQVSHALNDVATAFNRGTITTSFVSYATTISNHQRFQFATLKQTEIFEQKADYTTAFGYVPLPEVVIEARAPVEYTYFLDLNAEWRFLVETNIMHVYVPPIRFNKPAVDVSALQFEVRKGVLNYKKSEVQEDLKRMISGLVVLRARENIHLVRENGRRETEKFVENWLARSFSDGREYVVKVHFPDEKEKDKVIFAPKPLP